MKPQPDVNYNKGISYFIALCFIAILVYSCDKKTEIIPPKAEITNIYNVTDSSANVDVIVTQQSNAWEVFYFGLDIDTIPKNSPNYKGFVQTIGFVNSQDRNLNNSYTTKISKLKTKTKYYLSLYFSGNFDIGGPNETHSFYIGETKSFTTN